MRLDARPTPGEYTAGMRNAKSESRPGARASIAAMTLGFVLINAAAAHGANGGLPYDPCAVVSRNDVASAAGVAVDQVYAPTQPTKNECVWAVAAHGGMAAQNVALTIQSIDQVKASHGIAKFGALLGAIRNLSGVSGVSLPISPLVTQAFADAQVVAGLGDRAGWKNGTLAVLKNQALFQLTATGQTTDAGSLRLSRALAQSALNHIDISGPATPKPERP